MSFPFFMKRLREHLVKYRKECVLAPLFKLLEAVLELFVPLVVAAIIDRGVAVGNGRFVVSYSLLLIVLAFSGFFVSITSQYFSARAASGFARDVKHSLLKHIQSLDRKDIEALGSSTLITRMTSDMNQVQSGLNMALRLLLRSPFIVFGSAIMAFAVDFKAALVFVAVLPILCLIVFLVMSISLPRFKKVQKSMDKIVSRSRENLGGVRVIRAFNLEESECKKFSEENNILLRLQLSASRISILTNPVSSLIINGAIIVLLYTGAIRIEAGTLSAGAVVALVNYMSQILVELIKLANLLVTISKALASAKRVEAVFEHTSPNRKGENVKAFDLSKPAIEFKDVSFSYKEGVSSSLSHISLSLEKGSTLGVIGGTGSGKSTLAALLTALYDVTEGSLEIFGKSIGDYNKAFLHDNIAIALQKARLFKGTIRSNMKWLSPEATDEDIIKALKIAQAWEFVEQKGLSYPVEVGGRNFSGGQRQRLNIARAVIAKPAILILDDSASALDYATEKKLRSALGTLPCTKVIISQRAASILQADQILLLDDGKMVALGSHEELLKTSELYQEIYYSQFKREEKNV